MKHSPRQGLGAGKGIGYYNLVPYDSYVHALAAKGVPTYPSVPKRLDATASVQLLPPNQFDRKFQNDYEPWEQPYATTRITPQGQVSIYVRDDGDHNKVGKLLAHELKEKEIWWDLVTKKEVEPQKAALMAHNLNPVKVEGVDEVYYDKDGSAPGITELNAKRERILPDPLEPSGGYRTYGVSAPTRRKLGFFAAAAAATSVAAISLPVSLAAGVALGSLAYIGVLPKSKSKAVDIINNPRKYLKGEKRLW